jgi:hypothetical protein
MPDKCHADDGNDENYGINANNDYAYYSKKTIAGTQVLKSRIQ